MQQICTEKVRGSLNKFNGNNGNLFNDPRMCVCVYIYIYIYIDR